MAVSRRCAASWGVRRMNPSSIICTFPDGNLWSIPITLDVPAKQAEKIEPGGKVALRDVEGFMLAVLTVEDKWQPDKKREAGEIYGTTSVEHPGVRYLFEQVHDIYLGGVTRRHTDARPF